MSQGLAEALINAGVGAFIAVMVLVGIYRLVNRYFRDFIDVQRGQVEAVTRQARSMEALTEAIQQSTQRDNSEHMPEGILEAHLSYLQEKGYVTVERREGFGFRIAFASLSANGWDLIDGFASDKGIDREI